MGRLSIDISLENIWKSWYAFRRGKKASVEIDHFQYYLEHNIATLYQDIQSGSYLPSPHRTFTVTDNKRRLISVAPIRDRVVHRLLYDYLVDIYDKTFIFDAWSCRKNKGLIKAIKRAQSFLVKYPDSYIWRSDITKFFDSVDRDVLFNLLKRRVKDKKALELLQKIINSYAAQMRGGGLMERKIGIPIGNLTSQIFANIYLNELDRFVVHTLKPQAYLRYGDDFILVMHNQEKLEAARARTVDFLTHKLRLRVNPKNDVLFKAGQGIFFLGVKIFAQGRRLKKRNWNRAITRLNSGNISSYRGLVFKNENKKKKRYFNWMLFSKERG